MEKIRLDKFISSQLKISRTDAKKLMKKNQITVNSSVIKKGDVIIDADNDVVCAYGKKIEYKKYVYIMLNKPEGVVSASESEGDVTVIDILPDSMKRNGLFPAGRLDKNTTGFVLITDDGEFAHNILSPAHHVKKTYIAETLRDVTPEEEEKFRSGIKSGDDLFKPAGIKHLGVSSITGNNIYEVTITEGRYHQIKRMFASSGNRVLALRRICIGSLFLDKKLSPGEARELTSQELELVKK